MQQGEEESVREAVYRLCYYFDHNMRSNTDLAQFFVEECGIDSDKEYVRKIVADYRKNEEDIDTNLLEKGPPSFSMGLDTYGKEKKILEHPSKEDAYIFYSRNESRWKVIHGPVYRAMRRMYANEVGDGEPQKYTAEKFGWPTETWKDLKRAAGWIHDQDHHTDREHFSKDTGAVVEETLADMRNEKARKLAQEKYRRTQEKAEKWENFEDHIEDVYRQVKSVPTEPPDFYSHSVDEKSYIGVLPVADPHVEGRNYQNDSFQTCLNRVHGLFKETVHKIRKNMSDQVKVWYVPFLGDIFNADRFDEKTTKGTAQRQIASPYEFPDIMDLGVHLIEHIREFGCVKPRFVPGNHDRMLTIAYEKGVRYKFEGTGEVDLIPDKTYLNKEGEEEQHAACEFQFDVEANNFFMWTHSDTVGGGKTRKTDELMRIASHQARKLWGKSEKRYIFSGHNHEAKEEDHGSVHAQQSPSSVPSHWEVRQGFTTQEEGMFGYVFRRSGGQESRFHTHIDEISV